MKVQRLRLIQLTLVVAFLCALTSHGQGTFQNLDFENVRIIPDQSSPFYPNAINATNAVPGWTVNGNPNAPDVLYNTVSLGAPAVSLQGPGTHERIPQGSFSVILQGSTAGAPASVAVGQTGQIPANAQSLWFWGYAGLDNVSFNGQTLGLFVASSTANYNVYEADISAFSGQTGQLLFTAPPHFEDIIDNIQFSTSPAPEPGTWALILCGTVLFGVMRRRPKA